MAMKISKTKERTQVRNRDGRDDRDKRLPAREQHSGNGEEGTKRAPKKRPSKFDQKISKNIKKTTQKNTRLPTKDEAKAMKKRKSTETQQEPPKKKGRIFDPEERRKAMQERKEWMSDKMPARKEAQTRQNAATSRYNVGRVEALNLDTSSKVDIDKIMMTQPTTAMKIALAMKKFSREKTVHNLRAIFDISRRKQTLLDLLKDLTVFFFEEQNEIEKDTVQMEEPIENTAQNRREKAAERQRTKTQENMLERLAERRKNHLLLAIEYIKKIEEGLECPYIHTQLCEEVLGPLLIRNFMPSVLIDLLVRKLKKNSKTEAKLYTTIIKDDIKKNPAHVSLFVANTKKIIAKSFDNLPAVRRYIDILFECSERLHSGDRKEIFDTMYFFFKHFIKTKNVDPIYNNITELLFNYICNNISYIDGETFDFEIISELIWRKEPRIAIKAVCMFSENVTDKDRYFQSIVAKCLDSPSVVESSALSKDFIDMYEKIACKDLSTDVVVRATRIVLRRSLFFTPAFIIYFLFCVHKLSSLGILDLETVRRELAMFGDFYDTDVADTSKKVSARQTPEFYNPFVLHSLLRN